MRFPSLIRLSKNKRFSFEPRYYDPIKEEIEERTEKIKRELELESRGESQEDSYMPGRISFERKTQSVPNTSFLQLIIAAALGLTVIGWLYYGNEFFYVYWLAVPVYLYFRFRNKVRR
jgi:hypothetical protein